MLFSHPCYDVTEVSQVSIIKVKVFPLINFENEMNKFTFSGCVKNLVGNTGSLGESALHNALLLLMTHSATSHTV